MKPAPDFVTLFLSQNNEQVLMKYYLRPSKQQLSKGTFFIVINRIIRVPCQDIEPRERTVYGFRPRVLNGGNHISGRVKVSS